MVFPNGCFLCLEEEEMINHLVIHCPKTRTLVELLLSQFGVVWVLPLTVKDTLIGWNGSFVGKKGPKVWKVAPLCIFLVSWKGRNIIVFENGYLSIQTLKNSFM